MSAATSIEWTDRTWNPVRGCSMAAGSEMGGCLNCYAARQAARNLPAMRSPTTGLPFAVKRAAGPRWTGDVELIRPALDQPLHWRKPQRIFVNSMSDLFHESLPDGEIDYVFAVMALAGAFRMGHTFQILTKRAERARNYLSFVDRQESIIFAAADRFGGEAECHVGNALADIMGDGHNVGWPMRNVWLGVSVEDQKTADERIPLLLQTPAAVRFVSYEPALGPVDFRRLAPVDDFHTDALDTPDPTRRLDWVIVGGESGPGARPFEIAWARAVVQQCKVAGVACFVKQLGAFPMKDGRAPDGGETPARGGTTGGLLDRKGGNPDEWPAALRVREFPAVRA